MDSLGSDVSAVTNRAFSSPASNLSFFWNSFSHVRSLECVYSSCPPACFLAYLSEFIMWPYSFFSQVSQNKPWTRGILVLCSRWSIIHPIFLCGLFCTHGRSLLQLAAGGRCRLWASCQFMTEVSTVTNNCIRGHTFEQFWTEPACQPAGRTCKFHIEQP